MEGEISKPLKIALPLLIISIVTITIVYIISQPREVQEPELTPGFPWKYLGNDTVEYPAVLLMKFHFCNMSDLTNCPVRVKIFIYKDNKLCETLRLHDVSSIGSQLFYETGEKIRMDLVFYDNCTEIEQRGYSFTIPKAVWTYLPIVGRYDPPHYWHIFIDMHLGDGEDNSAIYNGGELIRLV